MRKIINLFKESCKELKNIRCITVAAMFGAISFILGNFTVKVTEFLKIGFSFLPSRFVYYLFGPFVGGVYGATMDVLVFISKPDGTFHPGFTFNAMLTGVIYGLILYKRPISVIRIFFANVVNMIIVNFFLNTYWLTTLIGTDFFVLLPPRAIKSLIMLPIETILLYSVIKGVEATGVLKLLSDKRMRH